MLLKKNLRLMTKLRSLNLTISVTKFGVSVENVVATIDKPKSHHGILLPDKKYSFALLPEDFET